MRMDQATESGFPSFSLPYSSLWESCNIKSRYIQGSISSSLTPKISTIMKF